MKAITQPAHDEEVVKGIIAANSGGRCVADSLDDSLQLSSLGIDSLKFIVVLLDVEARLGRKLFNVANVGAVRTVGELLALVRE